MKDTLREIKFRAWDKTGQKMLDVFAVNPMNQTVYISHQQLTGKPGDDVLLKYADIEGDNDVELMQYTGLKDKNGKEIYEGDIVWYVETPSHDNGKRQGVVKFESGKFEPVPGYVSSDDLSDFYYEKFEVIGNIYENKDLLK